MDEKFANLQNEQMVEGYFKKYRKHLEAFEKSLVSKATDIGDHHLIQLGKQLDSWELYTNILEANGSLQNLGELPKVALDVITATMSNSILPVIASTQAIEQQKSIIYFKNVRADNTKGNLTAGQKIVDPRTGTVTPSGYSSNQVENEEAVAATVDLQVDYVFTLAALPVRSQFLRLTFSGSADIYGEDVGPRGANQDLGTILGVGMSGTIVYSTGVVTIKFAENPGAGEKVFASYQQNLEEAADIPKVTTFLDQTSIEAKAYALKSTIGIFQQFALKKTFGESALDDMTMDLTREINAEIGGDFIRSYSANAQGTTEFDRTLPVGAAYTLREYYQNYMIKMSDAENVMMGNVGRGVIKVMIVGREHASIVKNIDGFKVLSDGGSLGAHIYGVLDGVTYIRVPEQALLDAKAGIGLYTGATPLESAGVYAPFMPLTITQLSPEKPNPLMDQKAAATMAGTKVVVPGYATKFNIIAS